MAKYRGKHNGQTRGIYREKSLFYNPQDREENRKLCEEIHEYLATQGKSINTLATFRCQRDLKPDKGEGSMNFFYPANFHVAGATIGLEARTANNGYNGVQLRFISNDNLNDIVQRVHDRFPVFKELNERYW